MNSKVLCSIQWIWYSGWFWEIIPHNFVYWLLLFTELLVGQLSFLSLGQCQGCCIGDIQQVQWDVAGEDSER